MNKISKLEFIKQIVDLLRAEVDEQKLRLILKDYTLYFNHELELGKSEQDVLTFLYSPELFIEKLRASNLDETLKKLGTENYNIFIDLTKDYNKIVESTPDTNNNTTNNDVGTNNDNNLSSQTSEETNTKKTNTIDLDISNTSNTTNYNIPNNKKSFSYIINFLLGFILLIFFIPIIICGFIAGFILVSLSILFSSSISLLSSFLSFMSTIFIILSSLCLLLFGIGTICLNIQLSINYVKYFFLINSKNLEAQQDA